MKPFEDPVRVICWQAAVYSNSKLQRDAFYEHYKKQIAKLNLVPKEYEDAIRQLCEALEY